MTRIFLSILLFAATLQATEIYATFTVEAQKHADLAFTSSGTVNKVDVEVASQVKEGEVLAQLQNDDLKAALQISQIALKYAQKDLERQKKVKKLVDAARFDSYLFKYENAKAQLSYQQALLDKTVLVAPFDGEIYEKSVEVGDVVSGAMIRTVLKIQSLHERKLVLEIDQKYWKMLKKGLTFRYRIDGDAKEYTGRITKIYPYANSKNRKIRAEIKVKDFIVGLFGSGHIVIPDSKPDVK